MALPAYSDYANKARTPARYTKVFQDLNATVDHASYVGVHTLSAYDPSVCAAYCSNEPRCKAFNIYVSRDPSKDPGLGCPNPPATANFKV